MKILGSNISNRIRLFFGILIVLLLCQSTLTAQISAPSASYSSTTEYTSGIQNEIFVFCDEAGVNMGELKAVSSDGESGWNFTWTKWNSVTASFDAHSVENGVAESTVSGLENGLYHVKVEKGAEVRDYQAWVINHTEVVNKPTLVFDKKNCDGVYFKSTYDPIEYKYSDYPNVDELIVNQPNPNPLTFVLKRNGAELPSILIPDYSSVINLSDDQAFSGSAEYKVVVIDKCGFEYESDPIDDISTYVVDADFTFNPAKGEAPLEVSFETKDDNATEYRWYFYKASKYFPDLDLKEPAESDHLLTDVINEKNPVYTYLHPGEYAVKLIVTSDKGPDVCEDMDYLEKNEFIVVDTSIFEVPNVFTPNGDGANDEFKIKLYSVKSYSVKIFNRWGRLVYEFQESDVSPGLDNRKSNKGWDGKISGKLAASGTYFYVVEAEGREEEGKHYTEKGALTLLHNK